MPPTTPAGSDDSAPGFSFPAVGRKKVTAAFDGGRLTCDGGVLLLAQAERAMGICRQLASCINDPRDPSRMMALSGGMHRWRWRQSEGSGLRCLALANRPIRSATSTRHPR